VNSFIVVNAEVYLPVPPTAVYCQRSALKLIGEAAAEEAAAE
jgi:hypothetical protein